jgi:ribokinase
MDTKMKDVIVFGSINMDVVAFCQCHPEVGETILGERVEFFPGGKGANQAVAAAKCGGQTTIIGCIGADSFGSQMLAHLASCMVNVDQVKVKDAISTGVALITVDSEGRNNIVVVPGANGHAICPDSITKNAIVLSQFESPLEEIVRLFEKTHLEEGTTVLNPSPYQTIPSNLLKLTDVLILNEHEYGHLISNPNTNTPEEIIKTSELATSVVPCCIVTLGEKGLILMERDAPPIHIPGYTMEVIDTTGAGDCFTGWLGAELGKGLNIKESAIRANAAAALSVTKAGAGSSVPDTKAVDAFLLSRC